ncbi:hypothetical protein PG984_003607 [Apiospora sp. TS-2023a]
MDNANKQGHPWAYISEFLPRGTGLGVINCDREYKEISAYLDEGRRVAIVGYTTDLSQYVFLVSEEAEVRGQGMEGCNVFVYYDGAKQNNPRFIALWQYHDPDVADRVYEYVSIARASHGVPWVRHNTAFPSKMRQEVSNCMIGNSLPKVLEGTTWDRRKRHVEGNDNASTRERDLVPETNLPRFCQSSLLRSQVSQDSPADAKAKDILDSGIVIFNHYNLPDAVMRFLDEVAKLLAPRDLLAPRGLLKLAILNWWYVTSSRPDDGSEKSLVSYLVYFVVMTLRVLSCGVATFPSVSEFSRACSRADERL